MSTTAADPAATADTAAQRAVLNVGAGRLLREIRDERGALAWIIDGVADDVELADRYGADGS